MLGVSRTVVNASVNLTRRVAATHESESDRAHVRSSDLLMCVDLTDFRSTNRLRKSNVLILTLFTMLLGYNKKQVSSFNRFFGFEFQF